MNNNFEHSESLFIYLPIIYLQNYNTVLSINRKFSTRGYGRWSALIVDIIPASLSLVFFGSFCSPRHFSDS